MGRGLRIKPHVRVETLEQLYREASDPVERSQLQVIWLLARDYKSKEVASVTGYTAKWVRTLARRYNQQGLRALGDRRHQNAGGYNVLLTPKQQQELYEALQQPHPREGLWNSRTVAQWIHEKTGKQVSPQRGWDWLKRLGFSLQRPRPRHRQATSQAQEEFKKTSF